MNTENKDNFARDIAEMIKHITDENTRLQQENTMLTGECNALRSQVSELERLVYGGRTG